VGPGSTRYFLLRVTHDATGADERQQTAINLSIPTLPPATPSRLVGSFALSPRPRTGACTLIWVTIEGHIKGHPDAQTACSAADALPLLVTAAYPHAWLDDPVLSVHLQGPSALTQLTQKSCLGQLDPEHPGDAG
ncbi:hypothetical protein HaLaN_22607, partial [Haematococcus lacustris]